LERAVRPRLTPREGRRFGLTVGAVFLGLALISRLRGHTIAPWILASLGGLLLLAGTLLPGRLTAVYRGWMRLGLGISKITTPIFMGLVYFLVLTPLGLVLRLLGKHPLKAREVDGSFWVRRDPEQDEAASLTRQF
jgi:Saxitoxin biosynthesis operon protein SxtJ